MPPKKVKKSTDLCDKNIRECYLNITCLVQITRNKFHHFVEKIGIGSNKKDQKVVWYQFPAEHQQEALHPEISKLIDHNIGKQTISITLTDSVLKKYFRLSDEKFVFLERELPLVSKDAKSNQQYKKYMHPKLFVNDFEESVGNELDDIGKINKFLALFSSETTTTKNELLISSYTGWNNLKEFFINKFLEIHLKNKEDLFKLSDTTELENYIKKKIEYYTYYTSISFKDQLDQIIINLNKSQKYFFNQFDIQNNDQLIAASEQYVKILNILPITNENHPLK